MNGILPAMKYDLPFTQSRLRLLGQKNNLDGELLLLAILRMSNVVTHAPSRDDDFSPSLTASSGKSLRVLVPSKNVYNNQMQNCNERNKGQVTPETA